MRIFSVGGGLAAALLVAAMFGPRLAGQGQASQTTPQQFGAISGVVVDGDTGQSIAGALVRHGESAGGAQITDSLGRFVFRGLTAPQGYGLTAVKLGYFGPAAGETSRDFVQVKANEWVSNMRLVLWRNGAISGVVLDDRGDPIAGATVRALRRVDFGGQARFTASPVTTTDDRGAYRCDGLAKGAYTVMVLPSEASPLTYYPSARHAEGASIFSLGAGEERRGVDIRALQGKTWRVTGRIDGGIPEARSGRPLRLIPSGNESQPAGHEVALTTATADGQFEFSGVYAGSYVIDSSPYHLEILFGQESINDRRPAMAPGMRMSSGGLSGLGGFGYRSTTTTGDNTYWGRARVEVVDRDVDNVLMTLERTGSISGRVVLDGELPFFVLRAESATADPSAGVPQGSASVSPLIAASTGGSADGSFRIEGLVPGRYFVRPSAIFQQVVSMMWQGRDIADEPVEVNSGQDLEGVVVTATRKTPTISGVVRDERPGAPRLGAVIYFSTNRQHWRTYGFSNVRAGSVLVQRDQYTITASFTGAASVGEYFLVAVPMSQAGAWRDAAFLEAASRVATRVTVAQPDSVVRQDLSIQDIR